MTAKFELITQAYVDHLVKYQGSSLGVALEHVVGIYSVPVASVKEYAADLRKQEHALGHVFLCPEVSRLLDIEGEGQYDGEVAGAWVRLLHSYASRYDKGIDQHGDTYWFVKTAMAIGLGYTTTCCRRWKISQRVTKFSIFGI